MVLREGWLRRRGTHLVASRIKVNGPGVAALSRRNWRLSTGVHAQLAQVAAQQGQVVFFVDAANAAQALDGALVVQVAHQRIAGIRRHGDDAAAVDDLRRLLDQGAAD
jgi:hypothetical protein